MSLWVIKVGTSLLRGSKEKDTNKVIKSLCEGIATSKDKGEKIILVSSGAVGLGCKKLKIRGRPKETVHLQAASAVGQVHLMALYESYMADLGYQVAQVLLTRSELGIRNSYQNASRTLKKLLDWNVLPIINENDIISDEELKYGDNDTLSALVATSVSADQLILLTDIDHLYSADPKTNFDAKPIKDIHHPAEMKSIGETQIPTTWGTGGIKTKIMAARIATESGITVQLADGRNPKILTSLLEGARGGTVFHPHPNPIRNRKSWLAHAIKPIGELVLDNGAIQAIEKRGASLLLVGVKKVEGNFSANQPVRIINQNGVEIGRGISSMSSDSIKNEITNTINSDKSPIVLHRDAMVLSNELVL